MLSRLRLPLGELVKSEVRRRAREQGLETADKPESFDICFVPDGDYAAFLATRLEDDHPAFQPGPVVTAAGERVGTHDGYCRFTIGQRRGLPGGFARPMYVVAIEPETRTVVIGESETLESSYVTIADENWLGAPPQAGDEVSVQIRHRGREAAGKIEAVEEHRLVIRLLRPQRAVTPGQSAAIYQGEVLLGGGRIVEARSASSEPRAAPGQVSDGATRIRRRSRG